MVAVLDASAALALLQGEPGTDVVAEALGTTSMSAVNFCEIWQKLLDHGLDADVLCAGLQALGLSVIPFGSDDAAATARLREPTRARGLSLADRACLALGSRLGQGVLTADWAWTVLDLDVDVRQIR